MGIHSNKAILKKSLVSPESLLLNKQTIEHEEQLRPLLKWAGGKRWLIPELKRIWTTQGHRRMVEPFCGGLAISLGLLPEQALLNDINPHLINFYKWVKRGSEISLKMRNKKATFYRFRNRLNDLIDKGKAKTSEAAQLFFYLNHTGYNGLCRFNKKGNYNVSFGKYNRVNYVKNLEQYQKHFSGWKFTNLDFNEIQLRSDDFIYADPPYDAGFTRYSKEEFGWNEQKELVEWLASHKGPVVLSNQATDRIVKLYDRSGYDLKFYQAPRMISCDGNRMRALEVLATKGI